MIFLKLSSFPRESCPLPEMSSLQLVEKDGFVFVWTGLQKPHSLPEDLTLPPEGFLVTPSSTDTLQSLQCITIMLHEFDNAR